MPNAQIWRHASCHAVKQQLHFPNQNLQHQNRCENQKGVINLCAGENLPLHSHPFHIGNKYHTVLISDISCPHTNSRNILSFFVICMINYLEINRERCIQQFVQHRHFLGKQIYMETNFIRPDSMTRTCGLSHHGNRDIMSECSVISNVNTYQ